MKISDLFLLRIGDYELKNIDGDGLSPSQTYTLWSFLNILTPSRGKTLMARGESDRNLRKHYGVDTNELPLLLNMMFNIGEKGRLCLNDDGGIDPDDISIESFITICQLLETSLKSAEEGSCGRIKRMKDFITKNGDFANAFISNKEDLIVKYSELSAEKKKLVNMYYLTIIHTINSKEYKFQSNFISTSHNFEIAEYFEDSLLIIGWMPKQSFQPYVASRDTNDFISICKSVGLPFAKTAVYPEQAEISIRYGILPHFIIGVKIKDSFYVNPSLFETMEIFNKCNSINQMKILRKDIIKNGLKVNQEKFIEYCNDSNYRRYFTYDGCQYRLDNL